MAKSPSILELDGILENAESQECVFFVAYQHLVNCLKKRLLLACVNGVKQLDEKVSDRSVEP